MFDQRQKLHLSLDALSNQKFLKGIQKVMIQTAELPTSKRVPSNSYVLQMDM